jgi:hypothetical protein
VKGIQKMGIQMDRMAGGHGGVGNFADLAKMLGGAPALPLGARHWQRVAPLTSCSRPISKRMAIREKRMIRLIAIAATAALIEFTMTSMGFAQQGGQQQQPPARGLDTALAIEAAQTAVNSCLDSGVKGSAPPASCAC